MSSSSGDVASKVITASCTLLSPSKMSDGSCPSSPAAVQAITLHTSSQKIVVPVATVSPSLGRQSSLQPASGDQVNTSVIASSQDKYSAADAVGQKPSSQKTGSSNPVTRRLRFHAKPNISKNARVR